MAESAREALSANASSEEQWRGRVAGLREENRTLRRLCGLEVESSEDEDDKLGEVEGPEGHDVGSQGEVEMREEGGLVRMMEMRDGSG